MSRIILIHWNEKAAKDKAAQIGRLGNEAQAYWSSKRSDLLAIIAKIPDAFVIDLSRQPSQGLAVGVFLRSLKDTRSVPMIFVGGDPNKVEKARELLTDSVYTDWDKIDEDLERAIINPPEHPVIPGAMDAYAGRSLYRKLGIKPGSTIMLLEPPEEFLEKLQALASFRLIEPQQGTAEIIILFARSNAKLEELFPIVAKHMDKKGKLWIAWPKKASGVSADLSQASVRAFGLQAGFVDYKISAIDDIWSGFMFCQTR